MKKLLFIVLLFSIRVSAQQIPYYDATGRSRTSGSGAVNQVLTNSGGGLMSWQPLSAGAVTSVFGRTGAVVSATNDYTFSQIGSTPTTIAGYGITDFNSLGDARWLPLAGGTLTGTVNSRTIQPSATLTYSLGGTSNVYVVNYTQQVTNPAGNLSVVAGGANSIIYSSNSVTQERMYTTGNHVSQNGGTFTDAGYRYDIISSGANGYFRSGDATITGLTASQFVTTDANKKLTSFNLFGSANTWTGVQTHTFGLVIGGASPINYNYGTFSTNFGALTSTANRTINLPDASGTVALTSDIPNSLAVLATVTGINTKNTGATVLYTVPAGKTAIITSAYIRCTAATAITIGPSVDIGVSAGDIYPNTSLTSLTAANKTFGFFSTGMSQSPTAAQVVSFNVNTAATGTAQTVEVVVLGILR